MISTQKGLGILLRRHLKCFLFNLLKTQRQTDRHSQSSHLLVHSLNACNSPSDSLELNTSIPFRQPEPNHLSHRWCLLQSTLTGSLRKVEPCLMKHRHSAMGHRCVHHQAKTRINIHPIPSFNNPLIQQPIVSVQYPRKHGFYTVLQPDFSI